VKSNDDCVGSGERQLLIKQLLGSSFLRRGSSEVGELCTCLEEAFRYLTEL